MKLGIGITRNQELMISGRRPSRDTEGGVCGVVVGGVGGWKGVVWGVTGEERGTPIPVVLLFPGEGADCHLPSLKHLQTRVGQIIGAGEILHWRRLPQKPRPLLRRLVGQAHDLLGSASRSTDNHFGKHFCLGRTCGGRLSKKPRGRAVLCAVQQCKREKGW